LDGRGPALDGNASAVLTRVRGRTMDSAERVALVAQARRKALLRANRHRLRYADLEECFSQATVELVGWTRAGGVFESANHAASALETRFLSRVLDRRRAVAGRSPMQAALEDALAVGGSANLPDHRCGVEELAMLHLELRNIARVASRLTADQRLVVACQVGLQMGCAEFCGLFGWSAEKYRKVAQRARARLRVLSDAVEEADAVDVTKLNASRARVGSDKEIGTHP
jgi:DNA-directed RNA polymerase specialized sigma24 family protein